MNIPPQAIQAAAQHIPTFAEADDEDAYREVATAALQAALPHLEAALRKQIATDIQERLVPADQTEVAVWIRNQAARIVEEGNPK